MNNDGVRGATLYQAERAAPVKKKTSSTALQSKRLRIKPRKTESGCLSVLLISRTTTSQKLLS